MHGPQTVTRTKFRGSGKDQRDWIVPGQDWDACPGWRTGTAQQLPVLPGPPPHSSTHAVQRSRLVRDPRRSRLETMANWRRPFQLIAQFCPRYQSETCRAAHYASGFWNRRCSKRSMRSGPCQSCALFRIRAAREACGMSRRVGSRHLMAPATQGNHPDKFARTRVVLRAQRPWLPSPGRSPVPGGPHPIPIGTCGRAIQPARPRRPCVVEGRGERPLPRPPISRAHGRGR